MKEIWRYCLIKIIIVFVLVVRLDAVTVNPAPPCPTNKIAPHKRTARWDQSRPRTFGSFYSLLAPTGLPGDDLIEKPQDDDCGDIADYDENDLSSIAAQTQRRQGNRNNRVNTGGTLGFLFPVHGQKYQTTKKPPVTFRPVRPSYPPTRPPYASGGVFSGNLYKAPRATDPSVHVKPVHDGIEESQITYRPGLVGAPSGLVIGAPQISPTRYSLAEPTTRNRPEPEPVSTSQKVPRYINSSRFSSQASQVSSSSSKRQRPKKQNEDSSLIGSFISLLFK